MNVFDLINFRTNFQFKFVSYCGFGFEMMRQLEII
jgi:hypothetical protein